MVRHHVKKKKTKKAHLSKEESERQKNEAQALKYETLNRFAGSSEEEDNNGSDVDDNEEIMNGKAKENELILSRNPKKRKMPEQKNDEGKYNDDGEETEEDFADSSAESSSDEGDDDEYDTDHGEGPKFMSPRVENAIQNPHLMEKTITQGGLAGAMSRILGGPSASGKSKNGENVILSKTRTPLQKLQLKEKQRRIAAREARNERRSERLTCMHVPLLAATTFQMSGSDKSMSQELELERMHRRVATRGVVALFNAITQHQQSQMAQQLQSKEELVKTKKKDIQNISKKGFLDMIKNKGVDKEEDEISSPQNNDKDKPSKQNEKKKSSSGGWNALKDDFMMNSKLKDWDKDVTSSSEEEGEE